MTLRVGVLGTGNIFERGYLPALADTGAIQVTAVCDLDPARAAAAAARLGGVRVIESPESLVALDDIDAVFVLTPTHTHADLAIAALECGKHVLCEKPMARSVADARRMTASAAAMGRRLMIGHSRRFDDRWTLIDEQIRAGRIGDPVYVFRSEHAWNGAPAEGWQWRDGQSGGVLWDVGIHAAELIGWYLGGRPRTAFAKVLRTRPEATAGGGPDAAVVTFDYGPSRHAVLSVSWFHPPAWGPFYATTEVVGTGGKIEAHDRDSHPATVVVDGLEIPRHSPLLSAGATTFRNEVEHFAAAVESGAPFAIGLDDALTAVEMIEAAERSARSGRPEPVAP
ncbi:MAG TPA: Gfo/Idh/MocA family oxidoreductase [Candidatus Limnocylindrales bacterium]